MDSCPWLALLQRLDTVDSTNTRLKALALDGAPEGTALLARSQTAGRGRMNRVFDSQAGGLYLSVLLRPALAPERLGVVTPMAAVAVREAILAQTGAAAQIKWVNDLLLNGKKLCGILAELVVDARGSPALVLGVGVNVAQTEFPPALRDLAVSLRLAGYDAQPDALAQAILARFYQLSAALTAGEAPLWLERYAAHCITINRDVTVIQCGVSRPAHALGLGSGGELLVAWPDGTEGSISSGEASIRL